jgi:Neutral/alkaline non-lysosomal ceramidase, N-terminal
MNLRKRRLALWASGICASLVLAQPVLSADTPNLKVGVAKVDITPKDLTDMVGIVVRPYGGIHDRLYARALVLGNGVNTAAIVALDLVEMGDTTLLRQRIARELAIPADHIIINASHDHSAPRGGPPTPGTSSAEGRPYSPPAYVQQVDNAIVDVLKQAKDARQPARVGFGTGNVDVNVARYGYTPERGWGQNTTEDGFADKTLTVVRFDTPSGTPIAILFNYAVHSNSMTGEPKNMINADIAGNAEKFVENQYNDKVVALWSMGAAADQYPKFNWDMGLLDDKTSPYAPGEIQGAMIGGEVMKVTKRITQMTEVANIYASERAVPCEMNVVVAQGPARPGQAPNGGAGGGPNGAAARPQQPQMQLKHLLPPPNPGDKLDIQLSFIRINQLAITGVSGEVGSQIFLHVKKESPFLNNIMITLSNDRVGYIPDDAGWDHMGSGAAYVRGCAEKAIVSNLVEMMNASLK